MLYISKLTVCLLVTTQPVQYVNKLPLISPEQQVNYSSCPSKNIGDSS